MVRYLRIVEAMKSKVEQIMRQFKALILGLLFLALSGISLSVAQENTAQGCAGREVEIADLQWPSATVLAHIHKRIISEQLGCKTRVVVSDLAAAATTLKTAQKPTLVPEMWPTRVADKWNQTIEARSAFIGGDSFDNSQLEGWYVPAKILTDFPALGKAVELGALAERYQMSGKPKFVSCPSKWACAQINRRLLQAFGLLDKFDIIEPENRINMDQLIGQMTSANTPFVFYYWQPNALIAQLDVRSIDMGEFDLAAYQCAAKLNCTELKPTAFPMEQIQLVLAEWVRGDAPELVPYARKAQMPIGLMNQLMAKMVDDDLSAEQIADLFVDDYAEVWQPWLPQINQ
jgi:glycine betaine/proline transport system substrate-binding protein